MKWPSVGLWHTGRGCHVQSYVRFSALSDFIDERSPFGGDGGRGQWWKGGSGWHTNFTAGGSV